MRIALTFVLTALLSSPVGAAPASDLDPFAHRTSPPSASAPVTVEADYVLLDPGKTQRTHAKIVVVSGLGLVLGSLALSLYERGQYNDALHSQNGNVNNDAANHAVEVDRYGSTPLFFAGAIVFGIGTYRYFTAPHDLVRHPIVAPTVSTNQVGLAVVGSF